MKLDPLAGLAVAPPLSVVVPLGVGLDFRLGVCRKLHFWGAGSVSLVGVDAPDHLCVW